MVVAAMVCAGVHIIGKAQLTNSAQTLKPRMLNQIKNKIVWNGYKTIHRIVYELFFVLRKFNKQYFAINPVCID